MSLTRFKNHIELIRGKTCSIEKSGTPYLSLNFLRTGEGLEYTNDSGILINEGDILIVVSGGNAGEIILSNSSGMIPATIAKISFNKNKIDKLFLYQELKKNEPKFRHFAKNSNFHFTLDILELLNTTFELPSLTKQIDIGKDFELKIKKHKKIISELEYIHSLIKEYKSSFINKVFDKKADELVRIKDVSNTKISLLPKEDKTGKAQKYLTAQSIKNGKINEFKTIILNDKTKIKPLKENTIILSLIGDNSGKVALIDKPNYIPSQSLSCIQSKHHLSIYLYLNYVKNDWRIYSKGSGIPSINSSVVKNQVIPIIKDKKILKNTIDTINYIEKTENLLYSIINFKENI